MVIFTRKDTLFFAMSQQIVTIIKKNRCKAMKLEVFVVFLWVEMQIAKI